MWHQRTLDRGFGHSFALCLFHKSHNAADRGIAGDITCAVAFSTVVLYASNYAAGTLIPATLFREPVTAPVLKAVLHCTVFFTHIPQRRRHYVVHPLRHLCCSSLALCRIRISATRRTTRRHCVVHVTAPVLQQSCTVQDCAYPQRHRHYLKACYANGDCGSLLTTVYCISDNSANTVLIVIPDSSPSL